MESVYKNGGWETERKKKKKEKFPSAREAVPSQTYRVLSVIAKCVLME